MMQACTITAHVPSCIPTPHNQFVNQNLPINIVLPVVATAYTENTLIQIRGYRWLLRYKRTM